MWRVLFPLLAACLPILASPPHDAIDLRVKPTLSAHVNSLGMRFVAVEPGSFLMGSPEAEVMREDNEHQHEVEITKPYLIGVTEVTQRQFREITDGNPSYFRKGGPGNGRVVGLDTDDFPVELVTWHQANDFLRKLGELPAERQRGWTYRLPTEAEWEYAARGGHATKAARAKEQLPFCFADPSASLGAGQANFNAAVPYGDGKKGVNLARPNPVGKNGPANALGMHDMHGNVSEWCADWFDDQYYKRGVRRDPPGPDAGSARLIRGGAFDYNGRYCRAAFRKRDEPHSRDIYVGFRAVAVPK